MTSILGIAGGVVSGIATMQQALADADVAEFNAKAAERDADAARLAAAVQVQYIQEAQKSATGTTRAVAAAQGARADEGSPLFNQMQIAAQGMRAQLRQTYQGEVAYAKYITESRMLKATAQNIRTVGALSAAARVLSGVGASWGSSQRMNAAYGETGSPAATTPQEDLSLPASTKYTLGVV